MQQKGPRLETGFTSGGVTMRIILVGFGNVGKAFLHMIAEEATSLNKRFWSGLKVVAVLDRRGGVSNQNGLNIEELLETDLRKGTVAATPKMAISVCQQYQRSKQLKLMWCWS